MAGVTLKTLDTEHNHYRLPKLQLFRYLITEAGVQVCSDK